MHKFTRYHTPKARLTEATVRIILHTGEWGIGILLSDTAVNARREVCMYVHTYFS